ncbi:MAG: sulfatase [bacterium]|nr:sulfatase [bacterium]
MIDTLRSDHLSAYGYPRETTPFIDRLASEGIQLQGYSASSWTRTSVATLLTGLYPQRHRALTRADNLPEKAPFLPEILRESGFFTAAYVSNATVAERFGFSRGYLSFHSHNGSKYDKPSAAQVTDRALRFLDRLETRYYLYVHYLDPHDPYTPEQPWGGPVDPAAEPIRLEDLAQGKVPKTEENLQRLRDLYDGAIHELDRELDRLFAALEEANALDNTLVVITADHGEAFGEHRSLGHGRGLHEEVVKVPFILWSTRALPSYRSTASFHQVDALPTFLEALGLEVPADIDGRSRWQELLNADLEDRGEYLLTLDLGHNAALGLISPPYKLIHRQGTPSTMLYELASDPREERNLVGEQRRRSILLRRLITLHNELSQRGEERQVTELDLETRERLAALGYLQIDTPQKELEKKNIPDRLHYYDDRVVGLFAGLAPADLSTTIEPARPSLQLLRGWIRKDEDGRWSKPQADFALPVRPGFKEIRLQGDRSGERPRVRLKVAINDETVDTYEIPRGTFEIVVPLPLSVRRSRMAYVEIHVDPPILFGGDGPEAGLFWHRLAIR